MTKTQQKVEILKKVGRNAVSMGFYIDLEPVSSSVSAVSSGSSVGSFQERRVAPTFFSLYVIAGFALLCMFLAAYSLLWNLAQSGSSFDIVLVSLIGLAVPFYLGVGVKLFWMRRFVDFTPTEVQVGYLFGSKRIIFSRYRRHEIASVEWVNRRPSQNVAPTHHTDGQYFIRGHWRIMLGMKSGKVRTLDRHTEKEALEALYEQAKRWLD